MCLSLGLASLTNAQIIEIPDANFKAMLLNATPDNAIATNSSHFGITIDTNGDGEIQVSEALQVYQLRISNAEIADLTGIEYFTNLASLNCGYNQLTSLGEVATLPNLEKLYCNHNQFTSLDVSGLNTLIDLGCNNNALTSLTLTDNLKYLNCSNNPLGTLDVSDLTNLESLICNSISLSNLDFTNLTNLQTLYCTSNSLTSLDVSTLSNLKNLNFSGNSIQTIDLSALANLEYLTCSQNGLTSLDVSASPNLIELKCDMNEIPSLDVSENSLLKLLYVNNNLLTELDVSNLAQLTSLICRDNLIENLDLNAVTNLETLEYGNEGLATVDVQHLIALKSLGAFHIDELPDNIENLQQLLSLIISASQLEEIDVSFLSSLIGFKAMDNENLTYVNVKNGSDFTSGGISFLSNPDLEFVCVNDNDVNNVYDLGPGNGDFFVSSYCTFTPGGNYNTITGSMLWNCDEDDATVFTKIRIYDGVEEGKSFTDQDGNYTFFTQEGTYILFPEIENPDFFNIDPPVDAVIFDNNNFNVETRNFCLSANGVNPDVEVVVAPLLHARPGFDAWYKMVYRNKGNQTVSGSVSFGFDDPVLDFVSSTPTPNDQSAGELTYHFSDLAPFENREVIIVMNVNGPQETPPVNIDDVLSFTTHINIDQTDVIPEDNIFVFNQVVVGSFDPNDITCIEGGVVTPDLIGEELHYLIRFENTGTYYAENIVVKMEIDPAKYDVESVRLLNTSHNAHATIKDDVLEVFFHQINLDSGGHGNILMAMRSDNSLSVGDSVQCKADIYFDFNYPIITNDAITEFQVSVSIEENIQNLNIEFYPNPTTDYFHITSEATIQSMELYDVSGRLLRTHLINRVETKQDVSNLPKGVYIIKVKTAKGEVVGKLVKE